MKISLTSYDLKIIALVAMLLDHFSVIFCPSIFIFRVIGRMAFVLFSFLLVEGFFYTKNRNIYLLKLIIFAFISQPTYGLAFHSDWFSWYRLNVFFTLAAGVITMMVLQSKLAGDLKVLYVYLIVVVSNFLRFDYFYLGILQIVAFYVYRFQFFKQFIIVSILNFFFFFRITVQSTAILGFIPLYLYSGKQGKKFGILFYTFYAFHLLVFGIIKKYILN